MTGRKLSAACKSWGRATVKARAELIRGGDIKSGVFVAMKKRGGTAAQRKLYQATKRLAAASKAKRCASAKKSAKKSARRPAKKSAKKSSKRKPAKRSTKRAKRC